MLEVYINVQKLCFSFYSDMWWIQFLGMMMILWTLKHPLWPHIEQTGHQQPQMMIWMR